MHGRVFSIILTFFLLIHSVVADKQEEPYNILWLVCEDNGTLYPSIWRYHHRDPKSKSIGVGRGSVPESVFYFGGLCSQSICNCNGHVSVWFRCKPHENSHEHRSNWVACL